MGFRHFCAALFPFLVLALCLFGFAPVARAERNVLNVIFVSPNGSGSGGEDDPASLEDALDWAAKRGGHDDSYVILRGGVYKISRTISIPRDLPGFTTFAAYPGETPVLSAGRRVDGFEENALDGKRVFIADAERLLEADDFMFVYNEAGPMSNARLPKGKYFYVKSADPQHALYPLRRTDKGDLSTVNKFFGFYADDGMGIYIPDLHNPGDVVMRMPHLWKDESARLSVYDTQANWIGLSRPTSLTINAGDRYYFENVREALGPGEWYLDRVSKLFYYAPLEGETVDSVEIYAGGLDTILYMRGCNNVAFDGITFTGTDWTLRRELDFGQAAYDQKSAILVEKSQNISFRGCRFVNIGATALKFGRGVTDSSVTSCIFERIGSNAIFTEGANSSDSPDRTERILIADNVITEYGRMSFNAVGVLLVHTAKSEVLRNEIHDGFYTAISAGWVWGYGYSATRDLTIADNKIYNIGQGMLSDMGGIYLLGTQRGTVVERNVIYNVRSIKSDGVTQGYGGWGIYLDEGASYITILENIVHSCGSEGLHINYGIENILKDNIIAYNDKGQIAIHHYYDHVELTMSGNVLVGDADTMINEAVPGSIKADAANTFFDPKRSNGGKSVIMERLNELKIGKSAVVRDPVIDEFLAGTVGGDR